MNYAAAAVIARDHAVVVQYFDRHVTGEHTVLGHHVIGRSMGHAPDNRVLVGLSGEQR